MTKISSPAHFVFVHGAFHGAWCWYKIKCLLECAGHKVTCLDLRSAGIDPSDPNAIFRFEEFNEPLDDVLSGLEEGEKVILVGHSAGGINLTAALHKYPEKIQVAVYLVAEMVRNGSRDKEDHLMFWGAGYSTNKEEEIYDYIYGEGPDQPPTSLMIKKQFQQPRFYQRSPLEDRTLAGTLLKPYPIRAARDGKFPDGGEEADKVPRVFIKTLDDNAISEEGQDALINSWPPSDVYSIDSDHSPFFSNPFKLFGLLLEVATKYGSMDGSPSRGIPNSKQKTHCGRCGALSKIEYQVSRMDKNFMSPYYACISCGSFEFSADHDDRIAYGRGARERQRWHKIGSQVEQVVSIDEGKEKEQIRSLVNEMANGRKETREVLSRIYDKLKILMLISIGMIFVLMLILATN